MNAREYTLSPAAARARGALFAQASAEYAVTAARFFKTGRGDYGEGDRFIGVRVPDVRKTAKQFFRELTTAEVLPLLTDPVHECRLLALLLWVQQFTRGDEACREAIVALYLAHTDCINNWDLVDLSAYEIVGAYLLPRDRSLLDRLAGSTSLWEQRIAIVSTWVFIRRGEFDDTLRLADRLLAHPHDLIQKAVGWMLREVGKRDKKRLESFLESRCRRMPRTMLRYAVERFSPEERARYMRRG